MREQKVIRAYIERHRTRRQSNKVLHGHPSPVFWNDRQVSVPDVMRDRDPSSSAVTKRLNLYVGTPYCLPTEPDRCGFCLFPSEVYKDRHQLDVYLDYLRREGEMFRPHLNGVELASIYFGGGTSNLYKAEQYPVLMDIVRGVFVIPPHIEVTLEGIPQTFSRKKLAGMKAAGINRISMGVQQVDDELIKASGRKQTSDQVFRTIEWCQELDLPISIDLIFGWPNQTTEHMLADLRAMVRPMGDISLKGKPGPVSVFELLDASQQDEITQVGPTARHLPKSDWLTISFQSRRDKLDYLMVRYLFGRNPGCDLVLDHPLVSRHHAEVRYQNNGFVLIDFSTNGTELIINGRARSLHHSQAALRGSGSIFLGRTIYNREFEISFQASGGSD